MYVYTYLPLAFLYMVKHLGFAVIIITYKSFEVDFLKSKNAVLI